MVGHAAHGDGRALFLVAGGERDFEFARGGDGVFEEELVEIAQAEEQQGVRELLLDAVVLPHQRRGGVSHESGFARSRSRVDSPQLDGGGHAIERHHVSRGAVVDVVLIGIAHDGVEALHHDLLQAAR